MPWKNISDKAKFEFNKDGDTIEGVLLAHRPTKHGCNVYDMETKDGERVYFFGSSVLDGILPHLIAKTIRVVYTGKINLDAGRTLREYEVNIWDPTDPEHPDKADNAPDYKVPF